jgi:hypothetical protein
MVRNGSSNRSFLRKVCESTAAKVISLVATIIGVVISLSSIPHKQPSSTNTVSSAVVSGVVTGSTTRLLQVPTHHSTFQSSSGPQSPNVSGVRRNVRIQYGSTDDGPPDPSPKDQLPVVPASSALTGSTTQTSHGLQSPNISGIDGNIDVQYGSAVPASGEKSSETK